MEKLLLIQKNYIMEAVKSNLGKVSISVEKDYWNIDKEYDRLVITERATDGNVYLSSMTPATVFINGREMKLSSADIASLLKSLPAGSVSKVGILRNPSAKYDAASRNCPLQAYQAGCFLSFLLGL